MCEEGIRVIFRTIDNASVFTKGGRAVSLPPSDSDWNSSVISEKESDNIEISYTNQLHITREEVMEIILDKTSNLKRLGSMLSDDSSLPPNPSDKEIPDDSFTQMESKKSKLKKKMLSVVVTRGYIRKF